MGCFPEFEKFDFGELKEKVKSLIESYYTINHISYILTNNERVFLDLFLISKNSIEKYINCINIAHNLQYFYEKDEVYYKKNLELLQKEYEEFLPETIEFYNDYDDCIKISKCQNGKKNEFIIVDKKFIQGMMKNKNNNFYENNKVYVYIDKNINEMNIKFKSDKVIKFGQKESIFYEFINERKSFQQSIISNNINNIANSQLIIENYNPINLL